MKKIIVLLALVAASTAFGQASSLEGFFTLNGSPGTPVSAPPAPPPIPNGSIGTFFNDRATFDGAFPAQLCEDFEESGDLGINAFPAPLDSTTNDGGYVPGDIIEGAVFQDNPINDSANPGVDSPTGIINLGPSSGFGNATVVLVSNTFTDTTDILITNPDVTAFGSDFVTYVAAVAVDITIFDTTDTPIDTFTGFPASNSEGSFLGYDSGGIPIGRINISDPTGGTVEGVDQFCIALDALPPPPAVPALNVFGLLALALLLMFGTALMLRRRAQ